MRAGRVWFLIAALLLMVGVAPIAVTAAIGLIARMAHCPLDGGSAYPCVIAGRDWGNTLATMGQAFWAELLTMWLVPVGAIALVVGIVRRSRSGNG